MIAVALSIWCVGLISPHAPTTSQLEAYTKFQEFHFEFRFDASQRKQYQTLLSKDYAANRLTDEIHQAPSIVDKWTKGDQITIIDTHSNLKRVDDIELSTEQMLNNGAIYGSGIAASTRREAKGGYESSQFLLTVIQAYQKPLRGDGNIYTSLFSKEIDSTYEWIAMQAVAVTGKKVWDGSPQSRAQFKSAVTKHWDKLLLEKNKLQAFKGFLNASLMDWLTWRLSDFTNLQRMSTYQRHETLDRWANQIEPLFPGLREQIQKQKQQFKTYVAQMSDREIREEFQRQQRANVKFAEFMQKREATSNAMQRSIAQMRTSMVDFHIANLNIAENLGNSGFVWTGKP